MSSTDALEVSNASELGKHPQVAEAELKVMVLTDRVRLQAMWQTECTSTRHLLCWHVEGLQLQSGTAGAQHHILCIIQCSTKPLGLMSHLVPGLHGCDALLCISEQSPAPILLSSGLHSSANLYQSPPISSSVSSVAS